MQDVRLAWLAGFWDGEGSIGLARTRSGFRLQAQLTNTCEASVREVIAIMDELGVPTRIYHYQEKREHHAPSWHLHVTNSMGDVRRLAVAVLPYSVTKREAWALTIQWIDRRIAAAGGLNDQGQLRRGGIPGAKAYTPDDYTLADRIRGTHRRPQPAPLEDPVGPG